MEFEGLIVLALDLQFGLQFFDEQFEARDFSAEFVGVAGGGGWTRLSAGVCLLLGRGVWRELIYKCVGEGPGPDAFTSARIGFLGKC